MVYSITIRHRFDTTYLQSILAISQAISLPLLIQYTALVIYLNKWSKVVWEYTKKQLNLDVVDWEKLRSRFCTLKKIIINITLVTSIVDNQYFQPWLSFVEILPLQ